MFRKHLLVNFTLGLKLYGVNQNPLSTLTTDIDTLNFGSNTTVVGVFAAATNPLTATLNAGDSIVGTGSGNTLRIVDTSVGATTTPLVGGVTSPLTGITLSGVQTLQVQAVNTGTANVYNLTNTTGVTTAQSSNSSVGVNFSGLAAGATVSVSGAGSAANNIVGFAYASGGSAVTVNLNGGVNSQFINNTSGTANATSATITSTGGVNGVATTGATTLVGPQITANTIKLTGAQQSISTLTVNAATNLRAVLTNNDFATAGAALVVTGAATSVNLGSAGNFRTIDASGLTAGGVAVNASVVTTSFIGGGGNDNLSGTAIMASTANIDAGAGTDTLAATLVRLGNGAIFKNFEVIDLVGSTGVDQQTLTNSTITGVSISGALGGTTATVANLVMPSTGFNVGITGSVQANNTNATTVLAFTSASVLGSTNTVNFNFNNVNQTADRQVNAGTFVIAGVEVVNIASGGLAVTGNAANTGVNSLIVTSNELQTVNITGARATVFNVTAQDVIGGATVTALSTVNASGMTAVTSSLTFVDNGLAAAAALVPANSLGGLTISGSAGNDSITVVTARAGTGTTNFGADTVNISQGGVDTIVVGAFGVNTAIAFTRAQSYADATLQAYAATTVIGAAAGDVIQFATGTLAANQATINISSAASLWAALQLAAPGGGAAGAINWFSTGGNTYLVQNVDAAAGLQATDIVVVLAGTFDISQSPISATGLVTLA